MVSLSKNLKQKTSKGAVAIFPFIAIGLILFLFLFTGRSSAPIIELPTILKKETPEPVSILFVGDIMFDRGVRASIDKNFAGDYNALFAQASYLRDADITFANLEGPVAEETTRRTGSRMQFRMDPKGILALKDAGFDVVSFANNHIGDYQTEAFLETLTHLNDNGVLYAGAGKDVEEASTPRIIEVRGMKIGFLGAADIGPEWMKAGEGKPGIILGNDPNLAKYIANAKSKVDILVMSFHWGNEYSLVIPRQEELAHMAIDAGADIVVGHHPHVMQKFEYYNNKPIFYSLGNFIFDQYFSEHTMRGMIGKVSIDPSTHDIIASALVSPISKLFIPQEPIPFDESLLLTKRFNP